MNKPTLLICDDEGGIRDAYKLLFEEDYNLFFASNGKEAVDYLRRSNPDLTIMDIKMPVLNGLDALKQMMAAKPGAKVLIVTGYESIDVAAEAVNLGAADYLTKPFERREVTEKVRSLIGLAP